MDRNNQKAILAVLAGIADPVLKKWAQQLAALVPEHSIWRNEAFESAIGAFKGFVETKAEGFSPAAGVAVEKATDFSDFLAGALGAKPGLNLDNWASEVLKDAGERLKNAANPAAELERIKLELKLRKELVELVKAEQPPTPNPPGEKLSKLVETFQTADKNVAEKIETWRKRQTWVKRGR